MGRGAAAVTVCITTMISVVQPPLAQMSTDVKGLGGTIFLRLLVGDGRTLVNGVTTDSSLVEMPVIDVTPVVELVRLTGNCIVGVVGRPSAFPAAVWTELVIAAGTTDDSELEVVGTKPAIVW